MDKYGAKHDGNIWWNMVKIGGDLANIGEISPIFLQKHAGFKLMNIDMGMFAKGLVGFLVFALV